MFAWKTAQSCLYKVRNFSLWESEEISLLLVVNFALYILGNVTDLS